MSSRYEVVHSQSFPMVTLHLMPGESVRVEPGAMVGMTTNVEMDSLEPGGLMGLVSLTGGRGKVAPRNRFKTVYKAKGGEALLSLAPSFPGQVYVMELEEHELCVQSLCFLAASTELEVDENIPGGGGFFSPGGEREEQYLVKVAGKGVLLLSTYGAPHLITLAEGQKYIVDTAHVVAFETRIAYKVQRPTEKVWLQIASAEGLVAEFTGPGDVLLQTRNLSDFATTLRSFM